MPDFRRGKEHIVAANEAAAKGGGDGDFRPFLSSIYWAGNDDTEYVMILNNVDEGVAMAKMQKVWVGNRFEHVVARTDPAIGENVDPLERDRLYNPSDQNIVVAVRLSPQFTEVKGRKRPIGFEVATRTFTRKVRDEATGELTEEREEVTIPEVGVIIQSPNNFFNHVISQDAQVAPVHETAARITRIGEQKDTSYEIELFPDQSVDLSNLIEFIDGLNYLDDDEMDTLLAEMPEDLDDTEAVQAAAELIGETLLNKRLNEMGSQEYYDWVYPQVTENSKYPKKGKGDNKTAKKADRKSRPSQRRAPSEDAPEADVSEPAEETPTPRARRTRASRAGGSSVKERLDTLKANTADAASA